MGWAIPAYSRTSEASIIQGSWSCKPEIPGEVKEVLLDVEE